MSDHRFPVIQCSAAVMLLLLMATASMASAQADAVLTAAKHVQGLIDQLADNRSINNENQLALAWGPLNEAEYRLPPEIKASVVGGGPPKGYLACHVMLANAGNTARLQLASRAHQEAQAAIQCYANALGFGSQPTDDCETYPQLEARQPNLPKYQLACSCQVKFKNFSGGAVAGPVRVGIPTEAAPDRWVTLMAEITPPTAANGVTVRAGLGVKIRNISQSNNIIRFQASGQMQSTSEGDRWVDVVRQTGSATNRCGRLPISVVVPVHVVTPLDTGTTAPIHRTNTQLSRGSSPSAPDVPPGQVLLGSYYWKWLRVVVADQFGKPIGDLYEGAAITERFPKGSSPINQKLRSDSSYEDPVGLFFKKPPGLAVPRDSLAAQQWPHQPVLSLQPTKPITNTFQVFADGFKLQPMITRTIVPVPPQDIQIH
jgi:hypothetical protein